MPANFFVANPDLLGGADLTTNIGSTSYTACSSSYAVAMPQGLQFQTSYAFGQALTSRFPETFRRRSSMLRDVGSPGDLTHAVQVHVVYDLPFGQGRALRQRRERLRRPHHRRLDVRIYRRGIQSGQLVNSATCGSSA